MYREGSTHTAILDRVESKAFCLNSSPRTAGLQSLSACQTVPSLAISYCYFHANCSIDLATCIPPLLLQPCHTRLSSSSHSHSVQLSNARVSQYSKSFILFSSKLWISLPTSLFSTFNDLTVRERFKTFCVD